MSRVPGGVVVVIPARRASSRLPAKPLLRRTGRYLVQHTYERALTIPSADAVVVATDDPEIADAVRGFGGAVAMTSPACATGTDRVAEVARSRAEDLVVNVQGDEPEFESEDVERLVQAMARDPSLPIGTLAVVAEADERDRPSAVKVVLDREGRALYFSRSRIPHHRDRAADPRDDVPPVLRHVGVYAYRREALLRFAALAPTPLEEAEKLEQLRALENGWPIRVVMGRRAPPGIDTPEDYEAFVARVRAAAEQV